MDDLPAFERLVHKHFPGARLLRAWELAGGISARTVAITAEWWAPQPVSGDEAGAVSHAKWVVRIASTAEAEFHVLRHLRGQGLPVPAPLAFDTSLDILPAPYLLMEFLAGQPDFGQVQPPGFARQIAAALARIHAVGSLPALSFLPRQAVRDALPSPANLAGAALETAAFHPILAAAWPFLQHNPTTLLHGDFWPGNLLWQPAPAGDSLLTGVVDWEDAVLGDPLADLAITRLDLAWIYSREVMEAFTRHYLAQATLDTRALPLWDLWAAARLARLFGPDLAGWAAFLHPYGRQDITPATIQAAYQGFTRQALDRLANPGQNGL